MHDQAGQIVVYKLIYAYRRSAVQQKQTKKLRFAIVHTLIV